LTGRVSRESSWGGRKGAGFPCEKEGENERPSIMGEGLRTYSHPKGIFEKRKTTGGIEEKKEGGHP